MAARGSQRLLYGFDSSFWFSVSVSVSVFFLLLPVPGNVLLISSPLAARNSHVIYALNFHASSVLLVAKKRGECQGGGGSSRKNARHFHTLAPLVQKLKMKASSGPSSYAATASNSSYRSNIAEIYSSEYLWATKVAFALCILTPTCPVIVAVAANGVGRGAGGVGVTDGPKATGIVNRLVSVLAFSFRPFVYPACYTACRRVYRLPAGLGDSLAECRTGYTCNDIIF